MKNPELVRYLLTNDLCEFKEDTDGNTPFHLAVKKSNYDIVSVYCEIYGQNIIHQKDGEGHDSIEIAKMNKDNRMIPLLQKSFQKGQLFSAVSNGDLTTVKQCIENGEDINQIDKNGFTALGLAVNCRKVDIVKYLIEKGANPFIGSTIKSAINIKSRAIFDLLIQNISNINGFDENGFTFLDYAVSSDQFNSELFISLIQKGAKLEQKNKHDDTSPFDVLVDERNIEAIDKLVSNGIPLDLNNRYSFTHAACELNNTSFLLDIIKKGGNVNFQFNNTYPLHVALKSKYIQQDDSSAFEDIKLLLNPTSFRDLFGKALVLLEHDADVRRPFNQAILEKDQISVFFYLVAATGCTSKTNSNSSLIDQLLNFFSSSSNKADSVSTYFLSNNKLLILASCFSPPTTLSFLIRKGYNIDAPDISGIRPIHHAIDSCKFANVRVFVESYASLQPPSFNIPSLLHLIASNDSMMFCKCPSKQFNYELVDWLVKYLIKNGESINVSSIDGETPLSVSVSHKNYIFAEVLLRNGAKNDWTLTAQFIGNLIEKFPPESTNPYRDDDLRIDSRNLRMLAPNNSFLAASSGDPLSLSKLAALYLGIEMNMNTIIVPKTKETILHVACKNHLLSFIRFLVINGADVNAIDETGKIPISQAIISYQVDVIQQLITPQLDLNVQDAKGRTPFSYACCRSRKPVLILLVSKGARINTVDKKGRSPIYFAAKYGNQEALDFLLSKKVLPTIADNRRKTPLHAASKTGKIYIIKKLLSFENNSNDNIRDINGDTPLHYAVRENQTKVIEFFLSLNKPSLILEQNRKGESPLSLAASLNQQSTVNLFIEKVGHFNPCESFNALKGAAKIKDIDYIKYLVSKGLNVNVRQRNLSIIDFTIENDLFSVFEFFKDSNLIDYDDIALIALAYVCGRRKIFDLLIKNYNGVKAENLLNGFLPNLMPLDQKNRVQIIQKVKKNSSLKYVPKKNLQSKGINANNNENMNDLIWNAFRSKNVIQMRILLEFGANPNARNKDGNTLLYESVKEGNLQIIDLLFSFGANPDKRCKSTNRSPLYLAIISDKIEIIMSFIMNGANIYSIDENIFIY